MTQIEPKVDNPADRCETCNGSGFVSKLMPDMPGEPEGGAVEPCPTCNGTGLRKEPQ
jgi:DnaJ-class molecular chaperone